MDTPELRVLNIALTDKDCDVQHRTFSDIWRDVDYIAFETLGEAEAFMLQKGIYAGQTRPDVVFLTLDEGAEKTLSFFKTIKEKPKLRNVPMILLVEHMELLADKEELDHFVHMMLEKPLSRTQLRKLAQQLVDFWMGFQEFALLEE